MPLAWATVAVAMTAATNPTPPAPGQEAAQLSSAKAPLEKGMTAAEIVARIGKPADVRPIAAPEGNAEVWTYRRLRHEHVQQVAATVTMAPALTGMNDHGTAAFGTVPDLDFHLEHVRDYQVTALLMFDGKLVMARQWMERERHIDP